MYLLWHVYRMLFAGDQSLITNAEQETVDFYPTGQNDSLELMFAKFATAKTREKLNPLKFSAIGTICLKTTLKMWKSAPPTGTRTTDLWIPSPTSSPTHCDWAMAASQKNTKVVREPFIPWISREDNTIANFCAL